MAALILLSGAVFAALVSIQARINKELFVNQTAETLRFIIGRHAVSEMEYAVFSIKREFHQAFPGQLGQVNPPVAAWMTSAISKQSLGDTPAEIKTLIESPAAQGEGRWKRLKGNIPGLWTAWVRPSAEDPNKTVRLAAIDLNQLNIKFVPGTEITHSSEVSKISPRDLPSLVAVFNGGYRTDYPRETGQRKDGVEYCRIRPHRGSVLFSGHRVRICSWRPDYEDKYAGADVFQNLPLLISDGRVNEKIFGVMRKNHLDYPAYRSGLGMASGERWLIYGCGYNLEPKDLATGLKLAQCVNAIHLDQNHGNVFFDLREHKSPYHLSGISSAFNLPKNRKVFLGSNRNFFYLTRAPGRKA